MVFFCFDGILMVENSDFPVQLRALRESMDWQGLFEVCLFALYSILLSLLLILQK
jgi:hypothetical protein